MDLPKSQVCPSSPSTSGSEAWDRGGPARAGPGRWEPRLVRGREMRWETGGGLGTRYEIPGVGGQEWGG